MLSVTHVTSHMTTASPVTSQSSLLVTSCSRLLSRFPGVCFGNMTSLKGPCCHSCQELIERRKQDTNGLRNGILSRDNKI